ncbi:MAG: hypothetical protein EU529_03035 [Promethearchaeota archaeon]|nr:MAG: hypothetical protein EU529_03035 [Candidatus Lokiarchaeota archaeon]
MNLVDDNGFDDSEDPIRRAYIFLKNHLRSPEAFSKEEFKNFADYPNPDNFDTYFSKKYRHFLEEAPNEKDKFLVSSIFKKYSDWEKFRSYYSQSSKIKASYVEEFYKYLMIFEFFMPLTNENDLRSSLDELFYMDTVKLALNKIPKDELYKAFPKNVKESEENYKTRLCNWISNRFVGYSIGTVKGRFKTDDLRTYYEEAIIKSKGDDYLVDETTAIVRFIFHVGQPIKNPVLFNIEQFNESLDKFNKKDAIKKEAVQIRYIFKNLFVKNILDLVNGEDEIWMLESGIKNRLYIWKNELNT